MATRPIVSISNAPVSEPLSSFSNFKFNTTSSNEHNMICWPRDKREIAFARPRGRDQDKLPTRHGKPHQNPPSVLAFDRLAASARRGLKMSVTDRLTQRLRQ